MSSVDLNQARNQLTELQSTLEEGSVIENVKALQELIAQCPSLKESCESELCPLTGRLYSHKEELDREEDREFLSELFYAVHHLSPKRIKGLLEEDVPVKNWLDKQSGLEAVIRGKQEHPIPAEVLRGTDSPCKVFFKSVTVKLQDGEERVCQGLLSRYSSVLRGMVETHSFKSAETVTLQMLTRDQFDTLMAYLETKEKALIHDGNALPLLRASVYLETPEVADAVIGFLSAGGKIDQETIIDLMNLVERDAQSSAVMQLDKIFSDIINEGLSSDELPDPFRAFLKECRERLIKPARLTLQGEKITDEKLRHLDGILIQDLIFFKCPNISSSSLEVLSSLKELKGATLALCDWVDDEALSKVRGGIERLSLASLGRFTGKGLAGLQAGAVKRLDLSGCRKLQDEDLEKLPSGLKELNLSLCAGAGESTFRRIAEMKDLRRLNISGTSIVDQQLDLLPKGLETLDLSTCPNLTGEGFEKLERLKSLKSLRAMFLNLTDDDLKRLPAGLQEVVLDGSTEITVRGVKEMIGRMPSLRRVSLNRCPNMTREILEDNPSNLEIQWTEPQPAGRALRAARSLL